MGRIGTIGWMLVTLSAPWAWAASAWAGLPPAATGARVYSQGTGWEVHPSFSLFPDTELFPGLQVGRIWRRGFADSRLSLAGARVEVEEPNDRFRFFAWRLRFERRFYVADRFYVAAGGGFHLLNPRTAIRQYFASLGHAVDSRVEPFAQVAAGYQLWRVRFRRRWFPVVGLVRYVAASGYDFPLPLPDGPGGVDPSGLSLSLTLEFRF